jgi:steroid delta-isomerase-like uncharacterized protein
MDSEDNKQLILEHYESFLQKHDAEAVRRHLAPDFRDHEMPPGTPPGPDGVLQFRAILHTAFPDLRIKIEDIIAEGDRVAVRATWTGTHRGVFPMIPVPVSNREVTFTGMVFWRIREGKIMERWGNIDRFGIQQQLTAQS